MASPVRAHNDTEQVDGTYIDLTTVSPSHDDTLGGEMAPLPPGETTPPQHNANAMCPVCLREVHAITEGPDGPIPATHVQCLVQCATYHGSCPNCRAPIAEAFPPDGLEAACSAAGFPCEAVPCTPPDTTHSVVQDYAARTFSNADAPEPAPPRQIRALCCPRVAAPALGFISLPLRDMTWAPIPHRGAEGINAWTGQWLCHICLRQLPVPNENTPDTPPPACPHCCSDPVFEIDCANCVNTWRCQNCEAALAQPEPWQAPTMWITGDWDQYR